MSIFRAVAGFILIVVAVWIFVAADGVALWTLGGAALAGGGVLLISAFRTRSPKRAASGNRTF